jgi:hypothetical protein
MAGTSLLALIDDVATVLDDVAILTKIAAKKTAGVLGDDLALNAQQVAGVKADRELPVVWAVAKGSLLNKAILVPAALAISALAPWAVLPLLMVGGAFLCYEGFEKLTHKFLHSRDEDTAHHAKLVQAVSNLAMDLVAMEKEKIKGAVRTDFILSAEIIIISLGTVAAAPFMTRVSVLTAISLIMTVGVYGLVAGIVKLDDGGLSLSQRPGDAYSARVLRAFGAGVLTAAPWLMKGLSVAGTVPRGWRHSHPRYTRRAFLDRALGRWDGSSARDRRCAAMADARDARRRGRHLGRRASAGHGERCSARHPSVAGCVVNSLAEG